MDTGRIIAEREGGTSCDAPGVRGRWLGSVTMTVLTDKDFAAVIDGSTDPLNAAVTFALGAASNCWERSGGQGVFQSARAGQIGEDLCRWLRGQYLIVDRDNPQVAGLNGCAPN